MELVHKNSERQGALYAGGRAGKDTTLPVLPPAKPCAAIPYMAHTKRRYFEGWYLKQQNNAQTVALIPAFHADERGRTSASLQIITDTQAVYLPFAADAFCLHPKRRALRLGESLFTRQGCKLSLRTADCELRGALRFRGLTLPAYDIMGPFRHVPFLQCRHSVFSLRHQVDGTLTLNGKEYRFREGLGYMEGDRGSSFPERYIWTHCGWEGGGIMLSVADIPLPVGGFTGCIGFVLVNGKEYRIASYCGVRILKVSDDTVMLRQGELTLGVKLLDSQPLLLRAPQMGGMVRLIRESASCRVRYRCTLGSRLLFDLESGQASFESNWDRSAKQQ